MLASTVPTDFAGLRVAAFESRRRDDLARMIEKFGGIPSVSPSMREIPLGDNPEAVQFANQMIAGTIDVVILMTGVGLKYFLTEVDGKVDNQQLAAGLSSAVTLARGPKPVAVLKEMGLSPTYRAPEPNTWREVLSTLDAHLTLDGKRVGIIEYGLPNERLAAELESRGAQVQSLKVYGWGLPEDCRPLEANVRSIAAGGADVVMFTSGHQAVNMLRMAETLELAQPLRDQLARAVVVSIGPVTSETLKDLDLPVDLEPEHPKMGHLVTAAAEQAHAIKARKQQPVAGSNAASIVTPLHNAPIADGDKPAWYDSPFMKACRREPSERTPIWLMRQAGRYLPEYRAIRQQTTFLDLCKNPALCAEVMVRTVERLGVDAAIIFSDLLPILEPMGLQLEFSQGEGPVIHNPVLEPGDVDRVRELEVQDLGSLEFVMETVRLTRAGIPQEIPVLGFAGAPFTLASYAIEGGASRNYLRTKSLMYRDTAAWNTLMERLARSVARYLNAQIAAGAQAVQIFDSWVGCLGPADYRQYVLPHTKSLISQITPGVPVINFATGNPALLPLLSEVGGDVIGIDWRVELDDAWRTVGHDKAVQGNLDPIVLLSDRDEIRRRAKRVLDQAGGRPGHIFNLGHGVLPQTPPENAIALIEAVKEFSSR